MAATRDRSTSVDSARRAWAVAIASSAATAGAYAVGASRAFGYDAAVTVEHFIATTSLADPFRRQVVYNNHVLFSFLDHLVYTATGSRSELVLRLLPIAAGAVVVGIVGFIATRRWGMLAGVTAAAVLATNPTFASLSRDVRGYSLMVLCAVVSSILVHVLRNRDRAGLSVAYVAVTAAGIATHLYMVLVVIGQVIWCVAQHWPLRAWARRWAAALVLGIAPYALLARTMADQQQARRFHASFPIDAVRQLLGGRWFGAAALAVLIVVAGAAALRAWPPRAVSAGGIVVVAFLWLVARPEALEARFFVWLVPLVALAAAAAVARWRPGIIFAAIGVAGAVSVLWPGYARDETALRPAAAALDATARHGGRPCAVGLTAEPLLVYTHHFYDVERPADMSRCDVAVIALSSTPRDLLAAARRTFPIERRLPASTPGTLFCLSEQLCTTAQAP